jgi:hypothetical protein
VVERSKGGMREAAFVSSGSASIISCPFSPVFILNRVRGNTCEIVIFDVILKLQSLTHFVLSAKISYAILLTVTPDFFFL